MFREFSRSLSVEEKKGRYLFSNDYACFMLTEGGGGGGGLGASVIVRFRRYVQYFQLSFFSGS